MATPVLDEAATFNAARQMEDPEARRLYIQQACGGDRDLQGRVEALLRVHEDDQTFLDSPTQELHALITASAGEGLDERTGPYKLLQPIGEGGMGTVFLAEQTEPVHRQVAIKVIRPGMDSGKIIARFEAERQALALMDHPHIAKVLDAGTTAMNRPYFVMELIRGVPITQYCDEHHLTLRERLEIFVLVCQAVQHAHQKGIIHRDLKPSNVLIALYDGKAVPKVIDFGILKAIGVRLTDRTLPTESGAVVGTLEYMSPEQAEPGQLDIDTRSDIYSLGVMLYEMLTGTTPLQPEIRRGASLVDLLRIIREEEPPRPSTRLSTTEDQPAIAANRGVESKKLTGLVRGDLDWIVMKCLEKDRTRRYATANALARDIERYLSEEPVEASPPSAGYRLRKFARKHGKVLAAAAAFALLLMVATAVSVWLAIRATLAEQKADEDRAQAVAEKERADEQAAIAEAVNQFLNGELLIQASPEQTPDRDLKLRTVLDRASQKMDGRFPSQPLVAARVHKTLGSAYSALGEFALAERHARRSHELYLGKLGPEDPDTIAAMNNLATALFYQQKLKEAHTLYVETLERERRVFGSEHEITLATMKNLGAVVGSLGQFEEACQLLEETLAIQQRVQGEKDRDTLATMHNLAVTYQKLNRIDDARKLYEKTLHLQREVLGPQHPYTLRCMHGLASLRANEGRHAEALKLWKEELDLGRQPLGPEHPILLDARKGSAFSLWQLGRCHEAIQVYEEVLQLQRRRLKPPHPHLLDTLNTLAWNLATAPDPKARNARRAVELAKEVVQHSPTQGTRWNTLGVAFYRAGDWSNAIAALEKSEELAPGQFLDCNALFLAMAHWKRGEQEKARQWYDRAIRWMEKNKSDDPEIVQFRAEAAQLLGLSDAQAPIKKDGK